MVDQCRTDERAKPADQPTPVGRTLPTSSWVRIANLGLDMCSVMPGQPGPGLQAPGGPFTTTIGIDVKTGSGVAGVGLAKIAIFSFVGQEVRHGVDNPQLSNCLIGSLYAMTSGSSPSNLATAGNLTLTGYTFPDARPSGSWPSGGSICGFAGNSLPAGVGNIRFDENMHN